MYKLIYTYRIYFLESLIIFTIPIILLFGYVYILNNLFDILILVHHSIFFYLSFIISTIKYSKQNKIKIIIILCYIITFIYELLHFKIFCLTGIFFYPNYNYIQITENISISLHFTDLYNLFAVLMLIINNYATLYINSLYFKKTQNIEINTALFRGEIIQDQLHQSLRRKRWRIFPEGLNKYYSIMRKCVHNELIILLMMMLLYFVILNIRIYEHNIEFLLIKYVSISVYDVRDTVIILLNYVITLFICIFFTKWKGNLHSEHKPAPLGNSCVIIDPPNESPHASSNGG